jgi:BED zinc finger
MLTKRKRSMAKDTQQRSAKILTGFDDRDDSNETCQDETSDEREQTASEAETSTDSLTRSKSNVWIYARRHPTAHGWAICDLCPSLPTPKRISTKGGATSTLRKHLVKVHKKMELLLVREDCADHEKVSAVHRDRLHKLLINAIVVDGRCFGDFRKPGFSRFLECAIPG